MKDTIHFDAPEFYPQNRIVMRVEGPQGLFIIVSEGEREALYGQFTLTGDEGERKALYQEFTLVLPDEFRSVFPDGNLPEMSDTFIWRYNAWFAVYEERSDEVLGEPMMSLAEAVTYALDLAYGEL